MTELYEAVNLMMARLGADGTISIDSPEVGEVMNALSDMDDTRDEFTRYLEDE